MIRKIVLLAIILLSACFIFAKITIDPPRKTDLFGDWIGCDEFGLMYYRLHLEEKGSRFASSYPNQEVNVYKIDDWKVAKGQLTILPEVFPNRNVPRIKIEGNVDVNRLNLQVKSLNETWSQDIIFFRERFVEKRYSDIRQAMKNYELK